MRHRITTTCCIVIFALAVSTECAKAEQGIGQVFTSERAVAQAFQEVMKLRDQQEHDLTAGQSAVGRGVAQSVPLPGTNGPVPATASPQNATQPPQTALPATSAQAGVGPQPVASQTNLVASSIKQQIDDLQSEISRRLASPTRSAADDAQIDALNDALSAKRQAYDLALGQRYADVSPAAAESYAATANPYFLMCATQFWAPSDPARWFDLISLVQNQLVADGRSVGILTIDDRPAGTAVVVGAHHVLTNMHVVKLLADYDSARDMWSIHPDVKVTFDKEYSFGLASSCPTPNQSRTYYVNAVYGVPKNGDDIAVLMTSADTYFPPKLVFRQRSPSAYAGNMTVAVIGYPGPPEDMTAAEQIQFFHTPITTTPQFAYKRLSEGFTGDQPVTQDGYFVHRANTSGGNSGSPVIDLSDGSVVGIHVQGQNRFRSAMGYNMALVSDRVNSLLFRLGLLQ